jgi:hypothetical protein
MATSPDRARTRVVCKIFIKATPQAVWDAIDPALTPPGGLVRAWHAGPSALSRSGPVSFELRDTLTGYTAVTVSRGPDEAPGRPASGSVSAYEWERLLSELKTVLEADGRERQRAGPGHSSPRRPLRLRPKLAPPAPALSGWRLSPD